MLNTLLAGWLATLCFPLVVLFFLRFFFLSIR